MKLITQVALVTTVATSTYYAAPVAASVSSIPMTRSQRGAGPFFYGSYAAQHLVPGNGSDVPAEGSVWPTGIYWTMVQIGTPPKDFPVAIDSGSGDLDISGKDCVGCVHGGPNREYDPAASSTSKTSYPFVFSNSYQTCDLKDPTVGQPVYVIVIVVRHIILR